jgi:hypothetical protein
MPSVGGKKNCQSFTVICRKPHVASSICLRHNFSKPRRDFVDTLYIFKELETFSVVTLSDVELGNNQWQTLLQISLVLLQNQATSLRRAAANILNKQSRTADKGWPSSLEVGRGACYISDINVFFSIMCKRLVVRLGHGKLRINKKY